MKITNKSTWLASLQWFFFIFANIIVIPITIGEAFNLSAAAIVPLVQMSFIVTGLACVLQAFFGHRRPILEGQSGLWWGVFLTLVTSATAQGIALETLGGSLFIGVALSGTITIMIGVFRLGPLIANLFTDRVMGVFMFLLGLTLTQIFFKGMIGIPFGTSEGSIHISVALLSFAIIAFVILLTIRSPIQFRSYAILIGIIMGWVLYAFIFQDTEDINTKAKQVMLFPLGQPAWNFGIILTAVLTGLLNTSNTFGALKGTDTLFDKKTAERDYLTSFSITGFVTIIAGFLGLVPYAPYVSSIGYLKQTNIYERLPFIIGSIFFY